MNTKISYLYRDADNYKMHNKCVIAGTLTTEQARIVGLRFNNLDFKYDRIHFIQQKTGNEQEYPMIPEVKFALLNYLKSARPSDDSDVVFLSAVSPYHDNRAIDEKHILLWEQIVRVI